MLILAAANSLLWELFGLVVPASVQERIGSSLVYLIAFNLVRAAIIAYTGWVVVHFEKRGLWRAAFAGALVFFVDHPIVSGGAYLLEGETQAFVGVLVSYVMFVWVAMLVACLGGFIAKFPFAKQRA